jgi:CDP-ribitol ribitolphosphotransferase
MPGGGARTTPASSLAGLEAAAVWWERIQLFVLLKADDETAPPDAASIYLRPASIDTEPIVARPSYRDGTEGEIRFNPFSGPDQMPLPAGRWTLSARRADGSWASIVASPSLDGSASASREFTYPGGIYRVDVGTVEPGRSLVIDTSVWAQAAERRHLHPVHRVNFEFRRLRRRLGKRFFGFIVSVTRRVLPRRGRTIVFTSDSRPRISGNLKIVHDRMVERGLARRFQIRSIFRPTIRARRGLWDRFRMVWLFASADVILLDDYQPAIVELDQRPDRRIIQLWHAWGAFKTVGYSRIGKPGGTHPYSNVHKNYTYAAVSSPYEVPFYAEAFGIPEERVIPTGVPRMDQFLDPTRQAARRESALTALPMVRDREVILFAPTFRGDGAKQAHYPMELIDLEGLHAIGEERNATIVVKMHPFVPQVLEIPVELGDRIVDASQRMTEVNDLLLISDLLITDYSSLIFEYSTLERPMLFFAYDLDEYVASRDFYEPFEEFVPGRIVRTFPELLDAIRRQDFEAEKVGPFAARHVPIRDGSATDRIIDELILPA